MRFRSFSLRTGLVMFLIIGISLGLVGRWVQDVRDRAAAQLWLAERGSSSIVTPDPRDRLTIDYAAEKEVTAFTRLIRTWVHPEYNRKLEYVSLGRGYTSDEYLKRLSRVFDAEFILIRGKVSAESLRGLFATRGLKKLNLESEVTNATGITDWSAVKRATQLEWIEIGADRKLDDELVRQIAALPTIKKIRMSCEKLDNLIALCQSPTATEALLMGGEGKFASSMNSGGVRNTRSVNATIAPSAEIFNELAKRENLDRLLFVYLNFADPAALTKFCESSNVTFIYGTNLYISPECLAEFAKLKQLTSLTIGYQTITPEHARVLKTMTRLKELNIGSTTPPELLKEIQEALPNCKM